MAKISITNILVSSGIGLTFLFGYHNLVGSKVNQKVEKIEVISKTPIVNSSINSIPATNFVEAANKSLDGVVHIHTVANQPGGYAYDPLNELFFGKPYQKLPDKKVAGSGSGVIISEDGYIVTNNHVINGASQINVTLNNKESFSAKLIGTDPTTDLAIIKIDKQELTPIQYGNSDEVQIGEWVLAVGNPFNLASTVTAGIVSAKGRNINILKEDYAVESFIQTDAAVNPGNSGGALVNINGELVGINTAIASNTGSYTGYSFAVPVNIVKKVTYDLIKYGNVQRGLLGVKISNLNTEDLNNLKLDNLSGVKIEEVMPNSAAAEANLEKDDIVIKVGTIAVNSVTELQEQVSRFRPGDEVLLKVIRNGETISKKVILKNIEGNTDILTKESLILGAVFSEISKEEKKELNLKNGVKVKNLSSGKLKQEGIKEGFIITKINHKDVSNKKEVEDFLKDHKGGILIEGIYPNGAKAYYGFGL